MVSKGPLMALTWRSQSFAFPRIQVFNTADHSSPAYHHITIFLTLFFAHS